MNLFTYFSLLTLKQTLKKRNDSIKSFGNLLKITKGEVLKISNIKTVFEMQVLQYLIDYYQDVLGLKFSYVEDILPGKFLVTSPFVNLSLLSYLYPKEALYKTTKLILHQFANSQKSILFNIKKSNSIVDHFEIYCADIKPTNFFRYKKKFYLLDIEDFYFMMYDKNNNLIHVSELDSFNQSKIIKYKERLGNIQIHTRKDNLFLDDYKYIYNR